MKRQGLREDDLALKRERVNGTRLICKNKKGLHVFNELSAYGAECGMEQMTLSETCKPVPFFDAESRLMYFTVDTKNINENETFEKTFSIKNYLGN